MSGKIVVGEGTCCAHFASLFDDEAFGDVKVIGKDGRKLKAQSRILSTASPVFKKMLEGHWKEKEGTVELKKYHWDVVIALISLIYSKPVDLKEDLLVDLYRAAHMYDVSFVIKAVVDCVPRLKSKECVVKLAITASRFGGDYEEEMASVCGSYLIKYLDKVVDIGQIPYKTMMAAVKAEETDMREFTILRNLLKWSREHEEVSLQQKQELFSHIRYGRVL